MAPCPQLGGGSMWQCVVCGSPAEAGWCSARKAGRAAETNLLIMLSFFLVARLDWRRRAEQKTRRLKSHHYCCCHCPGGYCE